MKRFLEVVIAFPIIGMWLLLLIAYPITTILIMLWILALSRYLAGE